MVRSLMDFRRLFSTLTQNCKKHMEERRWFSTSVERSVPQKGRCECSSCVFLLHTAVPLRKRKAAAGIGHESQNRVGGPLG